MPNDNRSVGRPANKETRMEPRNVPVQRDKPRLNDLRKVHPRPIGDPAMGNRPSGGAQKEPKKPTTGKERMQMRDVPIKHMTEAELAEWNPFSRYSKTPVPSRGDVLAWNHERDGMHVLHIRDGQLVDDTLVFSTDILTKQMQAAMQDYWKARNNRYSMKFNPKKAGHSAIEQYARDKNITAVKTGQYGREIPAVSGLHPGSSGGGAGPGAPSPSPSPPGAAANPGAAPTSPASNVSSSFGPSAFGPSSGNYNMNTKMGSGSNGPAPRSNEPAPQPREVSGGLTNMEKANFLKQVNPQRYNDQVLQQMMRSPWQIDQAYKRLGKIRGAAREAYPDTSYEREEPAHASRIGDLGWRGRMTEPKTPRANREFMQARDVKVERIHEIAEQEMEKMIVRTFIRMGLGEELNSQPADDDAPDVILGQDSDSPMIHQGMIYRNKGRGIHMKGRPLVSKPRPKTEGALPRLRARWLGELPEARRQLSVPDRHQLKIARDTMKMTDAGAGVMGGPNKEEARAIIKRLTGKPHKEVSEDGHLPQPSKALPGNIAGSGKDFRPKPGTNKSPKQPGNLIGSRKVNKVKPGFVG